jgi:hypothetical protein
MAATLRRRPDGRKTGFDTLGDVTNQRRSPAVRRAARVLALTPAIAVTTVAAAASADPPASWEDNPSVSTLHVLMVLVGLPLALFVIITLLVYLPSMVRGERYKPGQAWRSEPEWFGGPRGGAEALQGGDHPQAVTAGDHEDNRGGASARW